jgi:hypothetical protein
MSKNGNRIKQIFLRTEMDFIEYQLFQMEFNGKLSTKCNNISGIEEFGQRNQNIVYNAKPKQ